MNRRRDDDDNISGHPVKLPINDPEPLSEWQVTGIVVLALVVWLVIWIGGQIGACYSHVSDLLN